MAEVRINMVDAYVYRQTSDGVRFLLLKRSKTEKYEHLWQGVAGKIKKSERAYQTAIRELKEETGLDPSRMFVADQVSKYYESDRDRIQLIPVFGIEVGSDRVVLSKEHCEYQWMTIDEALQVLIWKGQRTGIKTVYQMITRDDDRIRWSEIHL